MYVCMYVCMYGRRFVYVVVFLFCGIFVLIDIHFICMFSILFVVYAYGDYIVAIFFKLYHRFVFVFVFGFFFFFFSFFNVFGLLLWRVKKHLRPVDS